MFILPVVWVCMLFKISLGLVCFHVHLYVLTLPDFQQSNPILNILSLTPVTMILKTSQDNPPLMKILCD